MKIITLILSLFMLFKPVLPVVEYVVFYDYIKNELCVNKDKPSVGCNGKCHLAKELANASDSGKDKAKSNFASAQMQIVFFQDLLQEVAFLPAQQYLTKFFSNYSNSYRFTFATSLFKPPVF